MNSDTLITEIFGKENNSDITFQFPLTWKVSKAEGEHTFLNMHYGTGKILTENNQSSAFDTEHNIANAIIQKKGMLFYQLSISITAITCFILITTLTER